MRRPLTKLLRNWLTWFMTLVLVASLAVWFLTRVTLPREIRIGTAVQGGLYYEEGQRVAETLRSRTIRKVQIVPTSGSLENCKKLRAGELDVAIVQAGSVSLHELAIVTPLHHDVVHVIVRKELLQDDAGEATIRSASDLAGQAIIVGLPGSGMQKSAHDILEHYGILEEAGLHEVHFTKLLDDTDKTYAAAIVTTGVENNDVRRVLKTGDFGLLPLDSLALAKRYRHFEAYDIPTNLWPPVPEQHIPTVTASAMVVVRDDASPQLVTLLLNAIFEDHLSELFPAMYLPQQARDISPTRLHPVTRRYHDPFGRYGVMHTVLEALVAGKELLFALGAAFYLAWDRWRRLKDREIQEAVRAQRKYLDTYLDQTLEIERSQMNVTDTEQLQKFLDDVTSIKLRALSKLTHEDLRGDRTFAIFLMQCANLISKIQLKIINYTKNA